MFNDTLRAVVSGIASNIHFSFLPCLRSVVPVTFTIEPGFVGSKGEEKGRNTVSSPEQQKEMSSGTAESYTADFAESQVRREVTLQRVMTEEKETFVAVTSPSSHELSSSSAISGYR